MTTHPRPRLVMTRDDRQRIAAADGPDIAAVESEVDRWDDKQLQCRANNHQWTPSRANWNTELRYWEVAQICPRCKSRRLWEMGAQGQMFGRPRIEYADGYLSKGLGRIVGEGRDVVRLAAVVRTFPVEQLTGKAARAAVPHTQAARAAIGKEAV